MTTPDLFSALDGPACKRCGRRPVVAEGLCAWCVKNRAVDAPRPPSVNGAPVTSYRAAGNVWPKAGTLRRRVLDAYMAAPDGLTEEECGEVTHLGGNTVRPRIWELRGENRKANVPAVLRDSGKRRKSRLGQDCVVWEIMPGVLTPATSTQGVT